MLYSGVEIELDLSEADLPSSKTRFIEDSLRVVLGANVVPGDALDANSRMHPVACLAHELAHAERFLAGFRRPIEIPDVLLDEAEASIHASFYSVLNVKDREDLVEDAWDRLGKWLQLRRKRSKI